MTRLLRGKALCWFAVKVLVLTWATIAGVAAAGAATVEAVAPGSCWAGVRGLKAAAERIAGDQPGTRISVRECGLSLEDRGRYVVLRVRPDFSCDRGRATFGRVFGGRPRPPTETDDGATAHWGDWVQQGLTRYYFSCEMGPGYFDVWVGQVRMVPGSWNGDGGTSTDAG